MPGGCDTAGDLLRAGGPVGGGVDLNTISEAQYLVDGPEASFAHRIHQWLIGNEPCAHKLWPAFHKILLGGSGSLNPERWESAESCFGKMALAQALDTDAGRADPRHRCGRESRDP